MSSSNPTDLVRLNIWLPEPVFSILRAESQGTAVSMSALVRQLVIRWAHRPPGEVPPIMLFAASPEGARGATVDPQVRDAPVLAQLVHPQQGVLK